MSRLSAHEAAAVGLMEVRTASTLEEIEAAGRVALGPARFGGEMRAAARRR